MLGLLAAICSLAARQQEPELLQPARHTSPSGSFVLEVDPSHRLGRGPAKYRLTEAGDERWSAEFPYSLWEAVVDDQGYAGGVAFANGRDSDGRMVVALLAPDGNLLLEESFDYENGLPGCMGSSRSDTIVLGVHHHVEHGHFVVRVRPAEDLQDGDESEQWWIYDLHAGRRVATLRARDVLDEHSPADPAMVAAGRRIAERWTLAARAVRDTPLTLCQWYSLTDRASGGDSVGATFVLCDPELRPVWSLPLPDDYVFARDDERESRVRNLYFSGAFVGAEPAPGRFEIGIVKESARVTFEVSRDDSSSAGWKVTEVGREHIGLFPAESSADALPATALPRVAEVSLVALKQPIAQSIHDVLAFDVGSDGSIRYVRGTAREGTPAIVSLDASGTILREVEIRPLPKTDSSAFRWYPLTEDAWVAVRTEWKDPALTSLVRVTAEGETIAIVEYEATTVDELVATEDGGFVVLLTRDNEFTSTDGLARFDRDGTQRWTRWTSYDSQDEGELFAPEDLAVLGDGTIVLLDNVRNLLQLYDEEGGFLRSVELAAAWGVEPSYPTAVVPLPTGDVLVRDFDGEVPWRRTSLDVTSGGGLTLARPDGDLEVGQDDFLRADGDGNLWSTDGRVLMQFDRNGSLVRSLGAAKDPEALEEPSAVYSDALGRIGVFDRRTQVVHLFDAGGSPLTRCIPEPADLEPGAWIDRLISGGDGSVHVALERYEDDYLSFDNHGGRIGRTTLGGERATFVPGTRDRWVVHDEGWDEHWIERISGDGVTVATVKRRADGRWFSDVVCIGVAMSGGIAVLDTVESAWSRKGPYVLSLHSPDAAPLRVLELPPGTDIFRYVNRIDYGSRFVTIQAHGPEVVVIALSTGRIGLFTVPGNPSGRNLWSIGLSPDENELWAVESNPPTLHRFALR